MKLVVLDRDGVINYDSVNYIKTPAEWVPIPGSLAAIARLSQAGYRVVVATNQSGLGRGLYDEATLAKIHAKMCAAVREQSGEIDAIFYCPHLPEAGCDCRKPKAGLFAQIAQHYQQTLVGVPAVGDSLRDLLAAQAVGCQNLLVLTGNGKQTVANPDLPSDVVVFANLLAAVDYILHE